eukprot:4954511-Amphidinium_carterae.1
MELVVAFEKGGGCCDGADHRHGVTVSVSNHYEYSKLASCLCSMVQFHVTGVEAHGGLRQTCVIGFSTSAGQGLLRTLSCTIVLLGLMVYLLGILMVQIYGNVDDGYETVPGQLCHVKTHIDLISPARRHIKNPKTDVPNPVGQWKLCNSDASRYRSSSIQSYKSSLTTTPP